MKKILIYNDGQLFLRDSKIYYKVTAKNNIGLI